MFFFPKSYKKIVTKFIVITPLTFDVFFHSSEKMAATTKFGVIVSAKNNK